jgi:hypothetical protein
MEGKEKTAETDDVVRTGIVRANSVSIIYFRMDTSSAQIEFFVVKKSSLS